MGLAETRPGEVWVLLPTKHLDHVEDAGLTCLADADASIHSAVLPLGQGPGNRRLSHFWTTSGWDWEVLALSDNLRRFFLRFLQANICTGRPTCFQIFESKIQAGCCPWPPRLFPQIFEEIPCRGLPVYFCRFLQK